MTRMFPNLFVFASVFLFGTSESRTGQILPPQNVSVEWKNDFQPQLNWDSPQHSTKGCEYEVFLSTSELYSECFDTLEKPPWKSCKLMEGGFLHLSVKTVCNNSQSEPAVYNITYPDLVTNLQCNIYPNDQILCTWTTTDLVPEPNFYYWLANEDLTASADDPCTKPLQACPKYTYEDSMRTGCELKGKINQDVVVLFNATLDNKLVRNTFKKQIKGNAKPSAPQWTVVKSGDKFHINWIPPNISELSDWNFRINYTECRDTKFQDIPGKTSFKLDVVSHCPYYMAIKAKRIGSGEESPWSEWKYFDAETDPYAFIYAAVIIPLMFAGLAILTFVFCRKNKDNIFPKVPQPRDLLSDISDNNNKSNVHNLYIPVEEEENCKITLVIDPQNNKIYS